MKYYDITKLDKTLVTIWKIGYEIIYNNVTNGCKYIIRTFNPRIALYEYLKAFNNENYNVHAFKNGKDITEKVNKMIEKL